MAYVYRHIRLDKNEPFYIGVGLSDDKKYKRACSIKNRNKYWNNIVSKTKYEVEIILDDLTKDEAFNKEIEFINLYKKKSDRGTLCNISNGGRGGFLSEEVNVKRRLSLIGHILSEETKNKIRQKAVGRKIPEEVRMKMSQTHKERGTGKWLKSKGHFNGNSKKVYQFDKKNNFIKEWACASYACKKLGLNKSAISSAINGHQKSAGGYIWKFKIN
jgi:hypothetical protein